MASAHFAANGVLRSKRVTRVPGRNPGPGAGAAPEVPGNLSGPCGRVRPVLQAGEIEQFRRRLCPTSPGQSQAGSRLLARTRGGPGGSADNRQRGKGQANQAQTGRDKTRFDRTERRSKKKLSRLDQTIRKDSRIQQTGQGEGRSAEGWSG